MCNEILREAKALIILLIKFARLLTFLAFSVTNSKAVFQFNFLPFD